MKLFDDKIKNKKYHTVRTVSKFNQKIIEAEAYMTAYCTHWYIYFNKKNKPDLGPKPTISIK
jgi:hypothetical protein